LKEYAKKYVNYCGGNNPKLMTNAVQKIPIPLPPLHVQKTIAKYLDTAFTSHEATLAAMQQEYDITKQYQKKIFQEVMRVKE